MIFPNVNSFFFIISENHSNLWQKENYICGKKNNLAKALRRKVKHNIVISTEGEITHVNRQRLANFSAEFLV